jgi:hypothetical protein
MSWYVTHHRLLSVDCGQSAIHMPYGHFRVPTGVFPPDNRSSAGPESSYGTRQGRLRRRVAGKQAAGVRSITQTAVCAHVSRYPLSHREGGVQEDRREYQQAYPRWRRSRGRRRAPRPCRNSAPGHPAEPQSGAASLAEATRSPASRGVPRAPEGGSMGRSRAPPASAAGLTEPARRS